MKEVHFLSFLTSSYYESFALWWQSLEKPCRNGPLKGKEKKEEQVLSLGPQVANRENECGICHIFVSFSDTSVHVTDLSDKETICHVTGGMKVKANPDESSP